MERNTIMNLNNMIYRIYEAENLSVLKENVAYDVRMLIPCSYVSILMADSGQNGRLLKEPFCVPGEFCAAEEKYIRMEDQDYLLWTTRSSHPIVIRESQVVSEEKRLTSSIYRTCYGKFDVYDTLQLSFVHEGVFLSVLTLFRTSAEGEFSDEDAFCLELLGVHLSRRFYIDTVSAESKYGQKEIAQDLQRQYSLTHRESEILYMIFTGITDDEIVAQIHISPNTLKKHIQNIYRKLNVSSRWELLHRIKNKKF